MQPWVRVRPLAPVAASWLVLAIAVSGCALIGRKPPPGEVISPWDEQSYAAFVRQNIADLNRRYSRDYVVYEFIVDTENGSTRIQNLIDPKATGDVIRQMGLKGGGKAARVAGVAAYLRREYVYVDEPEDWLPAKETFSRKRGDCKNLSLLLLSILVEAGVDAHGAISNGHMWVNAFFDDRWHVLETDPKPDRTPIYHIPGFYDNPLYKVYPEKTLKRKKIEFTR